MMNIHSYTVMIDKQQNINSLGSESMMESESVVLNGGVGRATKKCEICLQDIESQLFDVHCELEHESNKENREIGSEKNEQIETESGEAVLGGGNRSPKRVLDEEKELVDSRKNQAELGVRRSSPRIKMNIERKVELVVPEVKEQKSKKAKSLKKPAEPKHKKSNRNSENQGENRVDESSTSGSRRTSNRVKKPRRKLLDESSDFDEEESFDRSVSGHATNLGRGAICFLCNKNLNTENLEEINEHIDACLIKQELNEEASGGCSGGRTTEGAFENSEQVIEYEWAGQTRVRATALLESAMSSVFNGAPSGSGSGAVLQRGVGDFDVDIEVDLNENNEEVYGKAQYSQKDLDAALKRIGTEWKREEKKRVSHAGRGSVHPEEENPDKRSTSTLLLVIDSLKAELESQAELLERAPKCLVCMEGFRDPLTSVLCWHVHCESCWLKTLSVKKLCPQCKQITQPSDLRKIYM
ncbi:hypothetical protein BB559_003728 [Furculomyces boomerangus]|uniref:RING-type domain-containing protein n=1 Tax=Furculomyces boomerangus TaxID=61424 RepID=A0A2T9YJB7_9FUNG|nr:hypothetical protein BB559_003728 [Furculomyces boomerangus]